MIEADVGIIGGGLAGSLIAAVLGRAGISAAAIDVRRTYPVDFRSEKLEGRQLELLRKTGLADEVLAAAVPIENAWIGRLGRLINRNMSVESYGIAYHDLVNRVRSLIPPGVTVLTGRVTDFETSPVRQTIILGNAVALSVRLVVLATGNNNDTLRAKLGMRRNDISRCHSISVGFDIEPKGRTSFDFPSLTYSGETPDDRISYVSMFPLRKTMRANLFLYRSPSDPWLAALRRDPQRTLFQALPGLKRLTGEFAVTSNVVIRPVDLYATADCRKPGVVLVGDAFSTSCPAAGTGVTKVLTDVARLCHEHIPHWLATPGMGRDKIDAFYDDPEKLECERESLRTAFYMRAVALEGSFHWRFRRIAWFLYQSQMANRLRKLHEAA